MLCKKSTDGEGRTLQCLLIQHYLCWMSHLLGKKSSGRGYTFFDWSWIHSFKANNAWIYSIDQAHWRFNFLLAIEKGVYLTFFEKPVVLIMLEEFLQTFLKIALLLMSWQRPQKCSQGLSTLPSTTTTLESMYQMRQYASTLLEWTIKL